MSAPYLSIMSSGLTTLPLDLDILAPSLSTMPWVSKFSKGSSQEHIPKSYNTFVKNRAYMRWSIACSTPPMYWSTGIQASAFSLAKGISVFFGSVNLKKYHDEHTKVSIVSVSLFAGLPHPGQVVFTNSSLLARGEAPVPVSSISMGSMTGRSFSGTGTSPQSEQ